ncbi:MAG: RNA helicase, partial [Dokdonella sp.]
LAISLVSSDEEGLLRDIRRMLKQDIDIVPIAGFEPSRPLRVDGTSRPVQNQRPPQRHARRPHVSSPGGDARPGSRAKAPQQRNGGGQRYSRPA